MHCIPPTAMFLGSWTVGSVAWAVENNAPNIVVVVLGWPSSSRIKTQPTLCLLPNNMTGNGMV